MIPNIRIISDVGHVYESGSVIGADKLLKDFCEVNTDNAFSDWLNSIPVPAAVDFMAKAWGIDYEFC